MEQINEDTSLVSVSWKNYGSVLMNDFNNFLQRESYCDATLICESRHLKVHRVILSCCSIYFREIFDSIFCTHPFIVLKDIELTELEALIEFMYKGQVRVCKGRLLKLVKAAEYLKVKGLGIAAEESSTPSIKISNISDVKDKAISDKGTSAANMKEEHGSEDRKLIKNDDNSLKSVNPKKRKKSSGNSPPKKGRGIKTIHPVRGIMTIDPPKGRGIMTIDPKVGSIPKIVPEKDKRNLKVDPVVVLEKNIESDANHVGVTSQRASGFNNMSNSDYEHFAKGKDAVDLVSDNDEELINQSTALSKSSSHGEDFYSMDTYYHTCSECSFRAKSPADLVVHMRIHTVPKKTLRCGLCAYKTHKKELLSKHIISHSSNKGFKCKNCPYVTSLNIRLKKHEERDCKAKPIKAKVSFSFPSAGTCNQTITTPEGHAELAPRNSLDEVIDDLPSRISSQDKTEMIISPTYQKHTANSSLPNLGASANDLPLNTNKNVNRFSLDLEKTTKEIHPTVLEKEYFLCAFCPKKTASKSLLASHVSECH